MSGHSKWAQIKHKKAGTDAKRGALFSKLSRMISVAAREGGVDPAMSAKLRQVVEQARDAGMPKDNIERAIQRGVGSADADNLQAMEYEIYGPGGSAFLIEALTDNTNRTTNEVKHLITKLGGRLATAGSVAWLFERKAAVEFLAPPEGSEAMELALIDAGAEDTAAVGGRMQALVSPGALDAFQKNAATQGIEPLRTAIVAVPKTPVPLDPAARASAEALAEALEEHPDVIEVWTNLADKSD